MITKYKQVSIALQHEMLFDYNYKLTIIAERMNKCSWNIDTT